MTITDIENILGQKEIKPTSNRILVMRELGKATRPISLADLEQLLDYTLDKASIFRVLDLFAEKGVVHVIEDGSWSQKYEMCHSGGIHHTISDQHVHFYCKQCKETHCIETVKVPMVDLPEGFCLHAVNYMIKGICPKCNKSQYKWIRRTENCSLQKLINGSFLYTSSDTYLCKQVALAIA